MGNVDARAKDAAARPRRVEGNREGREKASGRVACALPSRSKQLMRLPAHSARRSRKSRAAQRKAARWLSRGSSFNVFLGGPGPDRAQQDRLLGRVAQVPNRAQGKKDGGSASPLIGPGWSRALGSVALAPLAARALLGRATTAGRPTRDGTLHARCHLFGQLAPEVTCCGQSQ